MVLGPVLVTVLGALVTGSPLTTCVLLVGKWHSRGGNGVICSSWRREDVRRCHILGQRLKVQKGPAPDLVLQVDDKAIVPAAEFDPGLKCIRTP